MTLELAIASCLEPPRPFGDSKMPPTGPLWTEACKHASDGKGQGQAAHALAV